MNARDTATLLVILQRIAAALEASNSQHDSPDQSERLLGIQERAVASMEEHNRHHREQRLQPAEPPSGVIQ